MTTSPLKFAHSFEQLKSRLQSIPAGDLKLLALAVFWPELKAHDGVAAYQSYFDEYRALLLESLTAPNLGDLLPAELGQLLEVMIDLRQCRSASGKAGDIEAGVELVASEAARKYFYVGAIDAGLACLTRTYPPVTLSLARPEPVSCPADVHICRMSDNLSEIDALRDLAQHLSDSNSQHAATVRRILRDWEITREALSYEEAACLFVEKDPQSGVGRGRLRDLRGRAEYRRAGAESNEVTFDNQLRAPDDPFVGVVHDALEAVNTVLGRTGRNSLTRRTNEHVRARYHVVESDQTFTGDSIGLAAGLVAYTQLLQPEVLKHERFLACEAAFTGGVDSTGRLTAVNPTTLPAKIKRAFFSPLRYLVLPSKNLDAAQSYVAELRAEYPRRRLLLVGANTIAEVIENRNIVRAEKVCMGQFVARKAVKYTRATKIQVPILLALLYALICLIYPKAWIGFDWNPQYVQLTERGFNALNADSVRLWSVEYECDALDPLGQWTVGDLDRDGYNEVAYVPRAFKRTPWDQNGYLFVYSPNGRLLFQRDCVISNEYPGDESRLLGYSPGHIGFIENGDSTTIITIMSASYPSRTHIRFWSHTGDALGWYINAGFAQTSPLYFSNSLPGGYLFMGINNRMKSACLFLLPRDTCSGVSPPYIDPDIDLEWVRRGNQLRYVLLKPSDLAKSLNLPYNDPFTIWVEDENKVRADTRESHDAIPAMLSYYFDTTLALQRVLASDIFRQETAELIDGQSVPLPFTDLSSCLDQQSDSVTYWTDSGWVTEGQLRAASN